jgi:hypothetical protein
MCYHAATDAAAAVADLLSVTCCSLCQSVVSVSAKHALPRPAVDCDFVFQCMAGQESHILSDDFI